jgi:hypothetical protein
MSAELGDAAKGQDHRGESARHERERLGLAQAHREEFNAASRNCREHGRPARFLACNPWRPDGGNNGSLRGAVESVLRRQRHAFVRWSLEADLEYRLWPRGKTVQATGRNPNGVKRRHGAGALDFDKRPRAGDEYEAIFRSQVDVERELLMRWDSSHDHGEIAAQRFTERERRASERGSSVIVL